MDHPFNSTPVGAGLLEKNNENLEKSLSESGVVANLRDVAEAETNSRPEIKPFRSQTASYYQIINVSPESGPRAIREAYIRTKSGFSSSQDSTYSLFSAEDLQKTLLEIDEAFRVLSDPTSKARYDASIGLVSVFDQPETEKSGVSKVKGFSAFSGMSDQLQSNAFSPNSANGQNVSSDRNTFSSRFEDSSPKMSATLPSQDSAGLESVTGAKPQFSSPLLHSSKLKVADIDSEVLGATLSLLSDPASSGFGPTLVKLRELFGVSQEEMIERTKININYIMALEADQFSEMPKPIYSKGFLRNYLKYLGIQQVEPIVTAYMGRFPSGV